MKEQSNLICGKFAVGRNYNLTHDNEINASSSVSVSSTMYPDLKTYSKENIYLVV